MSKLKLLAASLVMVIMASTSFAGISEGFRIGVGVADTDVNGSGSEVLKNGVSAATAQHGRRNTGTTSGSTTVGHLFLEKSFSNGFTLGIDYIPGEASVGVKSRTDASSTEGSTVSTNVVNKAEAEISNHITYYGLMPLGDSPIFVKGGITSMDVETKEVLGTGATYGNASVNGVTVGIGAHLERDNGLFLRVEANVAEYENLTLTGSTGNVIQADLDTSEARFSIGKSF